MRRPRQRARSNRPRGNPPAATSAHDLATTPQMRQQIDLNVNLGEGFGQYRMDGESQLLPYVTSANIACGAHAGDPVLMETALDEVRYHGLSLGAHIGYPDLAGFGRREIHLTAAELRASILYQLGALYGLAKTFGLEITQVRPHGFLYRQMFNDLRVATITTKAVAEFDQWLIFIGPAGKTLQAAAEKAGLKVAAEAWVDRTYDSSGHLLPHNHTKAKIRSPHDIIAQAQRLIVDGEVIAADGSSVHLDFQTIHCHASMPNAVSTVQSIRALIPHARCLRSEPYSIGEPEEGRLAYNYN